MSRLDRAACAGSWLNVLYGEIGALRGFLLSIESGEVLFDGKLIAGLGPEAIVKLGIAHVPEGRRLFPD